MAADLGRKRAILLNILCGVSKGVAESHSMWIYGLGCDYHITRGSLILQLLSHINDCDSSHLLPDLVVTIVKPVRFHRRDGSYEHVAGTGGDPELLIHLNPDINVVFNVEQVSTSRKSPYHTHYSTVDFHIF